MPEETPSAPTVTSAPVPIPRPPTPPGGRPSYPPPKHPAVQIVDMLGEIVFVVILGWLTSKGRASVEAFVGASFVVLGVQNSIRNVAARRGIVPPDTSGIVSLMLFGFSAARAFGVLALLCFVSLQACRLPPPDNCSPRATRCSPDGIPDRCSNSLRWYHESNATPCAQLDSVCCLSPSPYGNNVHACVPSTACLPETTQDGGAQ